MHPSQKRHARTKPKSSSGSVLKATKQFIEKHYDELMDYKRLRQERKAYLEKRMETQFVPEFKRVDYRRELCLREREFLRLRRKKNKVEGFQKLTVIGRGAFGEVQLVRERTTGRIFALKKLNKAQMKKRAQVTHVKAERDLMASAVSPWIVRLFTSFQDSDHLYLVMEYLPGGDLMGLLIRYDVLTEDATRFYIAESVAAIRDVHALHYMHRDIKPDNFILDSQGHIKLSDFGLASSGQWADSASASAIAAVEPTKPDARSQKESWSQTRRHLRAFSTVGTPDYIAPEILRRSPDGYGRGADWWSLGSIMFECLFGYPPFAANTPRETCAKILAWKRSLVFPTEPHVSREALSFLRGLLCEAGDRMDAEAIIAHPWLAPIQWDRLRSYRPPFVPRLDSPTDTRYFDKFEPSGHTLARATPPAVRDWKLQDPSFLGYTFMAFPETHARGKAGSRTSLTEIFGTSNVESPTRSRSLIKSPSRVSEIGEESSITDLESDEVVVVGDDVDGVSQ
eukprot:gnl/Dysnectes_brevis/901_a1000_1229.p1 GENE.gnl/Dysnectes_brevis/901_a1000_1229~~gnl/Dysnectes_brevis/901_a1000_1229.p1  ORF type:complete len:522 (+),score=159.39 gnl/Dysnectes_brevis/901_a1000_1229:36-1568(+)